MALTLPVYPVTLVLVLFRFVGIIGLSKVFGREMIPVRVRMAIALALAWFTLIHLPSTWVENCQHITTTFPLLMAILGELMLGAAIALICELFFSILSMAGLLLGRASSLMMAKMIDPNSGIQDAILSTLFSLLFTLLVLLWNGHLYIIKLVVQSFAVLPPGFVWLRKELLEMYVTLGGDVFLWGMRYAMPALMGGMIIAVAMGLMAKMAPEFNVLFLSLPIRLSVGIGILSVFVLYAQEPLFKIFETMLTHVRYIMLGRV